MYNLTVTEFFNMLYDNAEYRCGGCRAWLKAIDLSQTVLLFNWYPCNLKPRDSIHLSCAIERNISEIITDDADFDGIKEITRVPIKQ